MVKNVILLAAEEKVTDMSSALEGARENLGNNEALIGLLQTLLYILRGCGIVLLVYALGKMVLAFRNEDTENKLQAISLLFVAILLMTANSYLNQIFGGAVNGWKPL